MRAGFFLLLRVFREIETSIDIYIITSVNNPVLLLHVEQTIMVFVIFLFTFFSVQKFFNFKILAFAQNFNTLMADNFQYHLLITKYLKKKDDKIRRIYFWCYRGE